MSEDIDLEHFKKLLLEKKRELEHLISISEDSTKPVELDQTLIGRLSRMDAMQGQEMALAAKRRRENNIKKIYAALKRIAKDEYGYCAECDEPISVKRLEHNPAVSTCINCAK